MLMHLHLKRLTFGLEKRFHLQVLTFTYSVRHSVKKNRNHWLPVLVTSDSKSYCSSLKSNIMVEAQPIGLPLKAVVDKLKEFAPTSLAESWDNVGLLIEPVKPKDIKRILLTNDLTEEVMSEAVEIETDLIISYHPPIFAPLKSITNKTWKERLVATCLENKIALYSPHTTFDSVEGGVNDWLAHAFDSSDVTPLVPASNGASCLMHFTSLATSFDIGKVKELQSKWLEVKGKGDGELTSHSIANTGEIKLTVWCAESLLPKLSELIASILFGSTVDNLKKFPLVKVGVAKHGMGRMCTLETPLTLEKVVELVKKHINQPHLKLGVAVGKDMRSLVSKIAICAGSGASLLRGVEADLYLTGEMLHHDILDATHNGTHVILCNHSDSERGFLVPFSQLLQDRLLLGKVEVLVSQRDRDPLITV